MITADCLHAYLGERMMGEEYYCLDCGKDVFGFEVEIDEGQLGLYCPFCMDNKMSCGACDDSYEGD